MTPSQVKAIRVSLGETQREFALRFGVATITVSQWEQGKRNPNVSALKIMATIHIHAFSRSSHNSSVETCSCGKFRFTKHAGPAIVGIEAKAEGVGGVK